MYDHRNTPSVPEPGRKSIDRGQAYAPKRRFLGPIFPLGLFADRSISPEAKLLFARLLNYCGDKSECNPAVPTMARAVAMSEDKITRLLKELQQARLILRAWAG